MFYILRNSTAAAAFLVLAGAAFAQSRDWYQQREERFRGENWRGRLFTEVREDLNHVQRSGHYLRRPRRIQIGADETGTG
jgi:hypothetical protein